MENFGYNILAKLFYRITLGSKIVSEISFDIEKSIFFKKNVDQKTDDNHLFISGLARSGTTALLQYLYDTNEFVSLTYADMPFILAPNFGRKINGGHTKTAFKERAHKDGVFINNESPEAFDEVFWKVYLNNKYILKDRLLVNNILDEILNDFKNYIDLILRKNYSGEKLRYLSKNNNNILRIHSLLKLFPKSRVIIPFRHPLQHALSLLSQHNNFCTIQINNNFALNYMNWIGHYEFGLNHKPFYLNNNSLFEQMLKYNKEDINYWLLNWLNYYTYVVENFTETNILFSYERFCEDPNRVMNKLLHQINLKSKAFDLTPFILNSRTCNSFDKQIYDSCMDIYKSLNHLTN